MAVLTAQMFADVRVSGHDNLRGILKCAHIHYLVDRRVLGVRHQVPILLLNIQKGFESMALPWADRIVGGLL